ncbi:hypothetical protein LO762_02885 [Actinocorallia sp. API 0066]|uniref:hypothetical protein n=1 Tax=Actinocorallia sp. API 0066 TaxID=2896846 RepID=UPI001E348BAC|nr:hypothetical protein [Actinocorallia sp. API 0066]MCD0448146.1 hypothetical protein [Actinocorallia sp. API 0066]
MAVVVSGCGSSDLLRRSPSEAQRFFERATVPESELRLGGAVMAFFLGPLSDEMFSAVGEVHEPGYLVLVNGDGSFRTVRTKRMDMLTPAWSDHGLYFADEESDARLTESGLTKITNRKATAQNLMFALPDGNAVGVYNGGFDSGDADTDTGYQNQVAFTTGDKAHLHTVQGNYFHGALCDDQVFGLTDDPGAHAKEAVGLPGMSSNADPEARPQMLARLHPLSADGGAKVIAWRPVSGGAHPGQQLPCRDGVITSLSWDTDADGREKPTVLSWNTRTGEHRTHPLTFDDGTTLDSEDFGYAVQSLRRDHLQWVYADGRVFATDTTTGKTTLLFDTTLEAGAGRPTQTLFAFSRTRLHALTVREDKKGDIAYTVFDRTTGELIEQIPIPIPNANINVSHLILARMAVRPTL